MERNKLQEKIYVIWQKAKQHIFSVGGQFKKRQKQNKEIVGIPFFYDNTIKKYEQFNLVDYGGNNRINTFWKNCRKWFC
jgi:hypothetical protein